MLRSTRLAVRDASLSILLCGIVAASGRSSASIDEPAKPADLATVSLVGFRELDPELVIVQVDDDTQDKVSGLPTELFLQAAKTSEPVRDALKKGGKDEESAQLEDWFKAAQSVATSTKWRTETGSRPKKPISFKWPGSSKTGLADADFVIGLTASELFNGTPDQKLAVAEIGPKGNKVQVILLARAPASAFKGAYESLIIDQPPIVILFAPIWPFRGAYERIIDQAVGVPKWSTGVTYCAGNLSANPVVSSSAKFKIGDITFGKPRIFTAEQKKLEVPQALGEMGPVFWLDLFVTVRDLNPTDVEHLTFRASILPATAISLAMMPDLQAKLGVQESLGAGLGESLQKYLEQESQYQNLKPTIVPGGLRENTLFWKMSSNAIAERSYMFTTIVQVPAEIEAIDVVLSVEGRMRKQFLVRKNVFATERPITERIPLRKENQ